MSKVRPATPTLNHRDDVDIPERARHLYAEEQTVIDRDTEGTIIRTGLIEWSNGRARLVACPVCGKPFELNGKPATHIQLHDPEDFGLTPLGEGSDCHE